MTKVGFVRERVGSISVYSHGNSVGSFSGPKDVLDEIMKLQQDAEAYREQQTKQFKIGPLTMKWVFEANDLVNMYNLQLVLDCVEAAIEKTLKFASRAETYGAAQGYTLAVEHCADAVAKAHRANIGKSWFTEAQLIAILSSVRWETKQGTGVLSNEELITMRSNDEISTNRGIFNLGVEKAAEALDAFARNHGAPRNVTESCAVIRSIKKTGDDVPEFVEVVPVPSAIKEQAEMEALVAELIPMATELKDQDGHPVEMLVAPDPPIDPASLDWHYVECKHGSPNSKSFCGWFPTLELAKMHQDFWPQHIKDLTVIKPRSSVDPGLALHFPDQASSDVLRKTNEFLGICGIASVRLGERYFPEPALKTNQEWRAADPEIRELRAELGAMENLLHGMPPQNGSLVARLEALVERAAEMDSRGTALGVGEWAYELGDRVFKPKGSWWEGKVVGFYSTSQTPRGYAVQLQTRDDNGPVQIYPEDALEYRP